MLIAALVAGLSSVSVSLMWSVHRDEQRKPFYVGASMSCFMLAVIFSFTSFIIK
jgi:hypothetical protein